MAYVKQSLAIVLAGLCLSCGPSMAQKLLRHEMAHCNGWEHGPEIYNAMSQMLDPPKEFDHLPTKPYVISYITHSLLRQRCGNALACAIPGQVCEIILPENPLL